VPARGGGIIGAIVRRFRFLFVLVLGAAALSACRLDVTVDIDMRADGTGEVMVVATVDADVVAQMPGLAGSLVLDDASAAGWVVEGPTATDGGGLTVTLRHPFASAAEAAVLVNSLGPPFQGITLDRAATEDEITTTLTGSLVVANGFDSFGDANLVAAAGATPFRAQLDAAGATPQENMSVELTLTTPGEIEGGDRVDGGVRWTAPLDGSSRELSATAVLGGDSGSSWAGPVATGALVLLAVWLVGGAFLGSRVWSAQRRRKRRRPPPITRYR
jgi:hypothetical protein